MSSRFNKIISVRLRTEELRAIKKVVRFARDDLNLEVYNSEGHFIRCAILKLLRDNLKRLN